MRAQGIGGWERIGNEMGEGAFAEAHVMARQVALSFTWGSGKRLLSVRIRTFQDITSSTFHTQRHPRALRMENQKQCSIGAHTAQILMRPPAACTEEHDRACQRCWEKHLSNEVETMDASGGAVRCMFCLAEMDRSDLARLARKGTVERSVRHLVNPAAKVEESRIDAFVAQI